MCNSLASLYPEVAAQLHPSMNGEITADQIVAGSGKNSWWIDDKERVWQQSPCTRTRGLHVEARLLLALSNSTGA
jgi:hypothetical protein